MKKLLKYAIAAAVFLVCKVTLAATTWSAQDYDLYSGDFDGDGVTDILYIAKDSSKLSGIARGVGGGFDTSYQSWPSNFLGLQWYGNAYTVLILQNTATGNTRASILLQSNAPGGTSYLLQPGSNGKIAGVSQPIVSNGQLAWSSDQHRLVVGDFNNDGFADVFLQSTSTTGTNAIMLADANGQFSPSSPAQQWPDGFLGFKWATTEAIVYAGNFDGQYGTDLLIQARPRFVMINYDVPFPVPTYPPSLNGVAFAHPSGDLFQLAAVPGQALGYYQWNRFAFGVDWSPLVTNLSVGNFSGSVYTDILLQARRTGSTSYLVAGNGSSTVFATGATLASNLNWSADSVKLIPGNYAGGHTTGIYFQALTPSGTNASASSITGSSVSTTTQDPTQPPPGKSTIAPGVSPTSFTVSTSGASSYTIPLWAPPGVGRLQLKLALQYNSRSSESVLGVGWTISGLSTISRCNRTWAQDGAPQGLTLTSSDRLCLDGQQLKLTGGAPGVGGSTYATEIDSFSSISANGSNSAAPTSFTVTTKNGLIYDYGLTADSQILASASGPVRTWALSQIRDRVGNAIKLSYYNDAMAGSGYTNGTYRIKEIDYPYTASGQGPFYSVTFTYSTRAAGVSIPSGYVAGSSTQEPNQLNSISVQDYGSSTPTKTYSLGYGVSPTTTRLRLAQVQECSASECYPATTVGYQDGESGWVSTSIVSSGASVSATRAIPMDLNGDGVTDIVYPISNGSGYLWYVIYGLTSGGFSDPQWTGVTTSTTDPVIPADFTAHGSTDLLYPSGGAWWRLYWNGSALATANTNTALATAALSSTNTVAADINGDGLPDLIYPYDNNSGNVSAYVELNTTAPGGSLSFGSPTLAYTQSGVGFNSWRLDASSSINSSSGPSPITVADFNGDGRADLLMHLEKVNQNEVTHTTSFSYVWIELVSAGTTFTAGAQFTYTSATDRPVTLDWNGDGCTDVAVPGIGGVGDWSIALAQCAGNGFFAGSIDTGIPQSQPVIAIDWDGDGRQDLLTSVSNGPWQVARSTGTGVASTLVPTGITSGSNAWLVGDFDGDGQNDLAYADVGGGNILKVNLHNSRGTPPDLAISFTDGFLMQQNLTYVAMSQSNYTKCSSTAGICSGTSYPEQDYQGPLYIVNQLTASDGTGSTYQNQFWYYGATLNVQGRGFEGVLARRSYDSRNGLFAFDYANRAFPYTGMSSQHVITTSGSYLTGNLSCASTSTHCLSSWSATPANQPISGLGGYESRVFPYQYSVTQTRYESGGALDGQAVTSAMAQYTYGDGYGNATNIQKTLTDLDPTSPFLQHTWQSTVVSTYLNDASAWCIGLPTGTTVTNTADGQAAQTRTYGFVPDTHTLCREHQRIIEPSITALNVTQTLSYDACGNVSEEDVVGHDYDGSALPTRTAKYDYNHFSQRCQLPEMLTNALGQQATVSYRYDFGVPQEMIDPNTLPTDWSYDDFGRKTQERRPDGTTTNWTFKYCVNAPCWGFGDLRFLAIQTNADANGSTFFTRDFFFDGFERLRFDESNHALGTWTINQVRAYDSLGRLSSQLQPYSQSDNGYWAYSYDVFNRPLTARLYQTTASSAPLESFYSLAYAGRSTQLTDIYNNVTTRIVDVLGHLRRVVDPKPGQGNVAGAMMAYDYDSFGNLVYTKDAINAVSTATYNLRGFKTDEVDADAGSWHFNVDSFNEVTSYTDGKSQSIGPIEYDPLGRLTSRTEPEGLSTWTWGKDSSQHNIGVLQSVSGYGYEEDLGYDGFGRLTTRKVTTDQSYQYDYSYNAQGSLDTMIYPAPGPAGTTASRTQIQYGYSYGFPIQITDTTQASSPVTLWSLIGVNDYSAPTNETLGGGAVSIASSYTPWTNDLVHIQSGVGGSANNLQNLTYQWDSVGNLTSRQDSIQNLTEVFSYDALKRPTGSTLNNTPNFSATYTDASGNDLGGNVKTRSDSSAAPLTYDYTTQQAGCNYSGLPAQPHAVRNVGGGAYVYCYDANGNVVSRNGLAITVASYNLPTSLQSSSGGVVYSSQFSYGPDRERYQQTATYPNGTEITSYVGGLFEKITGSAMSGNTMYRHYVRTPTGQTIIIARKGSTSATTYALPDHLGSTDTLVSGTTGSAGALLARESFGPFGQRRASNWVVGTPTASEWTAIANSTRHGFTFQDELDNVGLIHMNGRVYDPNIGRFLSADPMIGNLVDSQSVNPYAYVGNRPLSTVDPSGDIAEVIVACCGDNPVGAGAAAATFVAAGFLGFLDPAVPPPPPATASTNGSAQSGTGTNPCATNAGTCSLADQVPQPWSPPEVTVEGSRLTPPRWPGDLLDGPGSIVGLGEYNFHVSPRWGNAFTRAVRTALDKLPWVEDFASDVACIWQCQWPGDPGSKFDSIVAAMGPMGMVVQEGSATVQATEEGVEIGTNIVYRGLAAGEDATKGLIARAPGIGNTIASHVAGASASQWISTSKSLEVALSRFGENGVVAIDLSKVPGTVVDLSRGIPGFSSNWMLSRWAIKMQEVVIQDYVPASAILPTL